MPCRRHRCFAFTGTNSQYISQLERVVLDLLKQNTELRQHAEATRGPPCSASPSASIADLNLLFKPQTPSIQQTPIATSRTQDKRPQREGATADFLARVPVNDAQWLEARRKTNLLTPQQVFETFQLFTLRLDTLSMHVPCIKANATPLETIRAYEQLQGVLSRSATNASQLSNFSLLLLFCICCVARTGGMTVQEVDAMVMECMPGKMLASEYCMRLRTTGKLVAGVIERLEQSIGYRASHLFVLSKFRGATGRTGQLIEGRWLHNDNVPNMDWSRRRAREGHREKNIQGQ